MEATKGFDRKAWVRLYDMRMGSGSSMVESARFANEQLGYPSGTSLVAIGSVPRAEHESRCTVCNRPSKFGVCRMCETEGLG